MEPQEILKRISEVKVRTLHGQVFTPRLENLFPEKDPSQRSSGQPVWSPGINSSSRMVLQIKSAVLMMAEHPVKYTKECGHTDGNILHLVYQKVDNIQTQCESRNQSLLTLAPPIWPIEGQQIGKTDSLACV